MYGTNINNKGKIEKNQSVLEGPCIFPFKHGRPTKVYNECMSSEKGPKCATEVSKYGTLTKYGYCVNKGKKEKKFKKKKKLVLVDNIRGEERKEEIETDEYDYLYPIMDDEKFNIKISEKKEFNDTKYDFEVGDVKKQSDLLCNREFEISPHQIFVKNYLSINTPYNSLLLYHGLGSGKTCSAIGIAEDMRIYMKQLEITKRIIIVASPVVQENFKLQLFDDRKLKLINGYWSIEGCTGSKYIKEINPSGIKNLTRDMIISQVKLIIKKYYLFMGYVEFSNFIDKSMNVSSSFDPEVSNLIKKKKLKKIFSDRLIIIDEVHNIRISDDNKNKKVATSVQTLVTSVKNIRLLLLSATPMYNNYKEIIWLINLMNINDNRSAINVNDVFDADGNFTENGERLLLEKSRGYISYVRGDNPYTFPYKIYPEQFDKTKSVFSITYPEKTINDKTIVQPLQYLNLYCIKIGDYQNKVYNFIINKLKKDSKKDEQGMPTFNNMEKFGYTMLQYPLEALNIVYPIEEITKDNYKETIGKEGLNRIMTYKNVPFPPEKYDYEYNEDILNKYGRIFSKEKIGKYSKKIEHIGEYVLNSDGIILIYSQYLDGGLVPVALALEELGLKKYGTKSLLKSSPVKLDKPLSYIMITGDKSLSPNNADHVKVVSSENNKDGDIIKVILISRAGSEGLDFTNIRQVHILEPWYNTNRIEQIIGRAVRNKSHKMLPFSKRNVMIFLYGTLLKNKLESVDMYIYRLAELKAIKIGNVSRVLKKGAIDCLLNSKQQLPTEPNMNQIVKLTLSTGNIIDYTIGDKSYSQLCDFMESCEYTCNPDKVITEDNINIDTYNELFILNNEVLIKNIKQLFKEYYFLKKIDLIKIINFSKNYPIIQINAALDRLINNNTEYIIDKYNRSGTLINIGKYYLFQPLEINNKNISLFDRTRPINYKRNKLRLSTKNMKFDTIIDVKSNDIIQSIIYNLKQNYDYTFTEDIEIKKGDFNWFKHCSNVINDLIKFKNKGTEKTKYTFKKSDLQKYIIGHLLDFSEISKKIHILNYLYSENIELNDFEKQLKSYLDSKLLISDDITGIFLQENKKHKLYILDNKDGTDDKKWVIGKETDYNDLKHVLSKKILKYTKANINNIIGFIISFKDNNLVFKTRSINEKGKRGARCDQASKNHNIKLLTKVVDDNEQLFKLSSNYNMTELCCYMEIIFRHFENINKNSKTWFIGPEYSTIINIEQFN